jgi:hypothetical protein
LPLRRAEIVDLSREAHAAEEGGGDDPGER